MENAELHHANMKAFPKNYIEISIASYPALLFAFSHRNFSSSFETICSSLNCTSLCFLHKLFLVLLISTEASLFVDLRRRRRAEAKLKGVVKLLAFGASAFPGELLDIKRIAEMSWGEFREFH